MSGSSAQIPRGSLPPFSRAALLLDLDGTLIDIAPTPDLVVVPPGLPATLLHLRDLLGGALAVITGRPIEQIDKLLPDIPTAIAGEHGGAIRHLPRAPIERPDLPSPPAAWLEQASSLAARHPGALLERKLRGFVLHYRGAPAAGEEFGAALTSLLAGDAHFELMQGRMSWEVRPRGADKGTAVRAIMLEPPFAGRLPVAVGDDVTDRDAIAVAIKMGGSGLFVPDVFGDAPAVRDWLATVSDCNGWD